MNDDNVDYDFNNAAAVVDDNDNIAGPDDDEDDGNDDDGGDNKRKVHSMEKTFLAARLTEIQWLHETH
ncbi:unnamed protein product [Protopolystoma xenopodis]|uniref:Uncharacterized protein n=1 Tax=Protopolystoma xenopodis TaxID=117903 RepID=A0A3S5CVF3_9PLAT|nr:unnamed protein product [Protopolystoma xenopodis]